MFNSLQPYGLWPATLFCPWYPPGKNTGVGCHALLQGPSHTHLNITLWLLLSCYIYFYGQVVFYTFEEIDRTVYHLSLSHLSTYLSTITLGFPNLCIPLFYLFENCWNSLISRAQTLISNRYPRPIISWEIDGETVETVSDFIFGGSKITADGDCSHEIKRRLLLGRKVMTSLDSIFKSRDITLPIVMYGCESWTVKKGEHQRIDAFELWCWRRLLRVPWTATRSNQSIL